jgi:hypothetical protein
MVISAVSVVKVLVSKISRALSAVEPWIPPKGRVMKESRPQQEIIDL